MLDEEPIKQVALDNLVRIRLAAVGIRTSIVRRNQLTPVGPLPHIGIVACIDVDSHSQGMFGEFLRARDGTVAETGSIVVAHRLLIIRLIVINQSDLLNWIACLIELAKDIHQVLGNRFVAD